MSTRFETRKSSRSRLISIFAALFFIACLTPSVSEARKRKKKKRKKPVAAKINVRAIGELMGPFKFGMTKEGVLKVLSRQLDERFEDKIKETSDVYVQDSLRREKKDELKKIKSSYREFTGTKTGWDVSIIDDQFGHKTDESMLVYWENNANGKDQRRFFFFHEGKLYKMFIALDSSMFPRDRRNFDSFKGLMTTRYGTGKVVSSTKSSGEKVPVLVDWQTKKFHVQAIDKLHFYGSFCLMIGQPGIEGNVVAARDAIKQPKKSNAVINSMLEEEGSEELSLDSNKHTLDGVLD